MPNNRNLKTELGKEPLILISNDDGVYSKGLHALANGLKTIGKVVVVAPDQQRSAASHAITLHIPLRITNVLEDFYAVNGTPTDCINIAINKILGKRPNLILSGINLGENLGDDIHYSGTVAAALEGGIMGIPSIALSVVNKDKFNFEAAVDVAIKFSKKILEEGLKPGIILNINVPNIPKHEIKGIKITRQGRRDYGNLIDEKTDPRGNSYYWIGGANAGYDDSPGTDCKAITENYISVTPLKVDATEHNMLEELKKWEN